jgi:hypothetical protein
MSRCHASLLFASVALASFAPASALAAGDCPDGWFCEDGAAPQAPPSAAPDGPAERPTAPPPDSRPPRPAGDEQGYNPPPYPPPGYPRAGDPDEQIIFDAPEPEPVQPRRHRRAFHEWGFNVHLEDALLGGKPEKASNAGMGGIGFGFRYRPLPPVAFEAGLDLLTGTDYQGYSRSEVGLLLNTLVFFNPHDVAQFYLLGGLGFSGADVTIAPRNGEPNFKRHDESYSYFGGQLGLGLEVRVSRRIAISGDLLGFVRGRTDDRADTVPEFTDPNTHRATNTSGGGLLRIGATFYW